LPIAILVPLALMLFLQDHLAVRAVSGLAPDGHAILIERDTRNAAIGNGAGVDG
jgi:hypothetical protein